MPLKETEVINQLKSRGIRFMDFCKHQRTPMINQRGRTIDDIKITKGDMKNVTLEWAKKELKDIQFQTDHLDDPLKIKVAEAFQRGRFVNLTIMQQTLRILASKEIFDLGCFDEAKPILESMADKVIRAFDVIDLTPGEVDNKKKEEMQKIEREVFGHLRNLNISLGLSARDYTDADELKTHKIEGIIKALAKMKEVVTKM